MAARHAGRFARRAFFNAAAAARPAARTPQQAAFEFASSRSGARIARLQSSRLRREVLTMLPMHSVTAKAWLVSRISDILVDAGGYETVLTIDSRRKNEILQPLTAGRAAAGRFARRAFFNAAAPLRPAAGPRAAPPPGFAAPRRSPGIRMNSPMLRREVSSMIPFHSVTANAWLVSRISDIPVDAGVFRSVLKMFQVEECSP